MGLMPIPASAVNPFFITADMLQPPWADPMAVMNFQKFLIGMGLKAGAVLNEEELGELTASLEKNGMKIDENMSTFEGITQTSKQLGGEVGRRAENMSENMDKNDNQNELSKNTVKTVVRSIERI